MFEHWTDLSINNIKFWKVSFSFRAFSSNFASAIFVIKTVMSFIAINEAKGTTVSPSLVNISSLVENLNHKQEQRSYQAIKTSDVGFWSHKRGKRTRNKIIIKSQKIPLSIFSHKLSKITRNKCLIKAQKGQCWFLKP